ncbi:hypothetical protein MJO28_007176 [Puccinia striiformis f. sp. tritici]|uniref:Uncharacterized protein n=2 Tax=Puccinia striiformis TaxID=27350 RepID=A0A2S4WKU4_9BASI|nr:hypothetical protein MJO28_007176 [Puccinia striiformis f. sp. tritici]POW22317.1 hypothetical protein PSHT_01429 [Puccinia striiformis]
MLAASRGPVDVSMKDGSKNDAFIAEVFTSSAENCTRVACDCGTPESRPNTVVDACTPNLKRLDATSSHLTPGLRGNQSSAITQLDISLNWECSLDGFRALDVA